MTSRFALPHQLVGFLVYSATLVLRQALSDITNSDLTDLLASGIFANLIMVVLESGWCLLLHCQPFYRLHVYVGLEIYAIRHASST